MSPTHYSLTRANLWVRIYDLLEELVSPTTIKLIANQLGEPYEPIPRDIS